MKFGTEIVPVFLLSDAIEENFSFLRLNREILLVHDLLIIFLLCGRRENTEFSLSIAHLTSCNVLSRGESVKTAANNAYNPEFSCRQYIQSSKLLSIFFFIVSGVFRCL